MKRMISVMLLSLLLCTGCANVPEPDPVNDIPEPVSDLPEETTTASEESSALTTTRPAPTSTAASEDNTDEVSQPGEHDTTTDNEETPAEDAPEAEERLPWESAYERVLKQRYRKSELEDAYFALIGLNEDDIPELVILDGTEMALYCCNGGKAELLLEDGYKSSAVMEQNVCYQPGKSLFSTAFSTMGGGSGFTIFSYQKLDTVHVDRYYFDNNENVNGEMPYNAVWDMAEEFEVTDNGYHDVTLGSSWTHIGTDFDGTYALTEANAERVGKLWKPFPEDRDVEE